MMPHDAVSLSGVFITLIVTIEYFQLKIEYLRSTSSGSILKRAERSDINKYSIFNLQSSIILGGTPLGRRIGFRSQRH
jgi:hypothetical protein